MESHTIYGKGAYGTIDGPHAAIHDGRSYFLELDEQLGSAAVMEILLRVPAGKYIHLVVETAAEKLGRLSVIEDGTYTSGGVAATPANRSRTTGAPASAVVTAYKGTPGTTPIVHAAGTAISQIFIPTTGKGGFARWNRELILKPGADTVIRYTSGAASNDAWLGLYWYEPHNS